MNNLNKIRHPKSRVGGRPANADDVCWAPFPVVVVRTAQKKFAEFSRDQVVALGMTAFLLTVIIMLGSPASGAQQASSSPPTAQKPDPISEELATIPARPDSAEASSDLIRRRFELIRQLVPGIGRIAVLWQPRADSALATLQYAGKAASTAGVSLQFFGAGDFSQLEEAVSDISTGEVHAILVMPDPMLTIEHKYIVQSIAKTRMPAIYAARVFVEDGGLMSYGPYLNGLRPHRAPHPEKILDKLNPTDLPVEQLTKFEFVINLKTAKALGIEVPPTLLSRVDEVIE